MLGGNTKGKPDKSKSSNQGSAGTRDGGRNSTTGGGGSPSNPASDKDVAAGRGDGGVIDRTGNGNPTPAQQETIKDAYSDPSAYAGRGGAPTSFGDATSTNEDAWREATEDAQDDGVGGLAGLIGLHETPPEEDDDYVLGQEDANWGFDPAVAIGGLAGLAFGVPFAGTAADLISQALDRPLDINLGPGTQTDEDDTLGAPGGTAADEDTDTNTPGVDDGGGGGDAIDDNGGNELPDVDDTGNPGGAPAAPGDFAAGLEEQIAILTGKKKPPRKPPGVAPPGYSTVSLGDVVSASDLMGV